MARTVAAISAGRAARTEIVQTVRQRLTPSAAEPSVQPRGVARSASYELVGPLADAVGLPWALSTMVVAAGTVAVLGGRAGHEDRARAAAVARA